MAMQPDTLQDEIARRTGQGWVLVSRGATEAQMRKPKRFSFVWALLWLLVFGLGIIVYLLWHWAKSDQLIYIRVVDGQLVVKGGRSMLATLFAPVGAYWRWAGQRQSTQGKVLAFGGPVAVVIVLIIIIWVASATGGGGDGEEQAAAEEQQQADAGNDLQQPAEPTETPEPQIERIVQAAPGAVAQAEDVRITLNEIADPWVDPSNFAPQQPAPGKRFVAFDVTIERVKGSQHYANQFNFKLTNTEGFAYEPTLLFGLQPLLSGTDIGSGEKIRGWFGFEVDAATPLDVLKYDPQIFTTSDVEFHFR